MRTLNVPMDDELYLALDKAKSEYGASEGRNVSWKEFLEHVVTILKK